MSGKANQGLSHYIVDEESKTISYLVFFHGLLCFWGRGMSLYGEENLSACSPGSFDFSLLSLQGLLHSCLAPCYVCKQVSSLNCFSKVCVTLSQWLWKCGPWISIIRSGNGLEVQILGSTPDLLIWNWWSDPAVCVVTNLWELFRLMFLV